MAEHGNAPRHPEPEHTQSQTTLAVGLLQFLCRYFSLTRLGRLAIANPAPGGVDKVRAAINLLETSVQFSAHVHILSTLAWEHEHDGAIARFLKWVKIR